MLLWKDKSVLKHANACSMHSTRRLAQAGTNTVVTTGNAMANTGNNNFVGAAQQAVSDPQNAQNANLAAKQVCFVTAQPAALPSLTARSQGALKLD